MKSLFLVLVVCCFGALLIGFTIYYQNTASLVSNAANKANDKEQNVARNKPKKSKAPASRIYVKVKQVVDGDTIVLENNSRLRYIGIDTPEKNDPRKPVQCFAEQATQKNRELVEGKFIWFVHDVNEKDRYGRLLGYVYLADGTFVNLELVKSGYAFAVSYPPDVSKQAELKNAERIARENSLGLWGGCSISTTPKGRYQTNSVNQ
ncbi:thermonuclease family protein [bacterium]|nr:MAG: thermonuclease family protein [bacterium]